MPITEVNIPSGKTMKVQHPEGASTEDILRFAKSEYSVTTDKYNLFTEAGKAFVAGGIQAAINAGAGVAQTYGMMLGPEMDESEESIRDYVAKQGPGSRMTAGKVRAHRKAKNKAIATVNENAHRMREIANGIDERLNIDPEFAESLPGQIARGFGQVPVTLAAGAAGTMAAGPAGGIAAVVSVSAPQLMTEAINDAERTLGKDYGDMDPGEKDQVALSSIGYITVGTALETVGFLKTVPGLKRFLLGQEKLAAGKIKSLVREAAEGFAAEGFTESAQGQLLDALAAATYDDDRELMSKEVLLRRFNEFLVGGVVGGGTTAGVGIFERAASGRLFKPRTEDQAPPGQEEQAPRDEMRIEQPSFAEPVADEALRYRVTYTELTGEEAQLELEASNPEDAINKVATGLGLDASGMRVETIIPFAEPEVSQAEEEVDSRFGQGTKAEESASARDQQALNLQVLKSVVMAKAASFLREKGLPITAKNVEQAIEANPNLLSGIDNPTRFIIRKQISDAIKLEEQGVNADTELERDDFSDAYDDDGRQAIGILQDVQFKQENFSEVAKSETEVIPIEPMVTPAEPEVTPPAQDLDVEAIREQESIISDADARIMELESEVDIEKSNIKEARAENKKKIAEVRKSNLSKEEKQDRIEDLKAELQDTIDDINGNIGIYKEEISAFKSDRRKAAKKLSKLTAPIEPTLTPEEEAELQAELQQEFLSGDQDAPILYKGRGDVTAGAGAARPIIQPLRDIALPIFEKVKNGLTVTAQESQQLASVADKYKPVTKRVIPEPETTERMRTAHKERKAGGVFKRDLVGAIPSKVKDGDEVASRLDIPSYNEFDTWTVTVHEIASKNPRDFNAGDVIGYDSTMYLTDATFGIGSEKRGVTQTLAITKGAGKGTIATIRGKYKKVSPEETKRLADQFDKDPAWTQVGMDPERRNYFYNREDGSPDFMREVIAAEAVLQIGPVVLAKNVQYGPTPSNEFISRLAYDIEGDVTAGASKKETRYIFVDPWTGESITGPMTIDEVREEMRLQDLQNEFYDSPESDDPNLPDDDPRLEIYDGPFLDYAYMREYVPPGDEDVTAGASAKVSKVSKKNDSSRVGTAKLPGGTTNKSNINTSIVTDEVLKAQMASIVYRHLPDDIKGESDTKKKYEKFVEFIKDNLLYLHDKFPAELRARATLWYDGANKISKGLSNRYNLSVEQVAAVIANLSPQKDWFMNVAQAEQVLHVYEHYQDFIIEGEEINQTIDEIIDAAEAPQTHKKKKKDGETKRQKLLRWNFNRKLDQQAKDKRASIVNGIRGKTIRELNKDKSKGGQILTAWAIRVIAQSEFGRYYQILSPEGNPVGIQTNDDGSPSMNTWGSTSEIRKALSVIENGSLENISNSLGDQHKVRNFYNNIVAPNSPYGDATIDTHAVAAGLMMPLGASATQVLHNFGGSKIKNDPQNGVSGTYHIYLEAYRRAARERNIQPRQMQSITWEAVRKLFLSSERNPSDIDKVTKIWNKSRDENTARDTITGQRVLIPDWARTRNGGEPEVFTTGLLGQGRENVLGGSLQFRGRKSGPITTAQSTERAIERLGNYRGTVSYRAGDGKKPRRGIKTAKGKLTRLSQEVFSREARGNKKAHKYGSSVDVYSPKQYDGYDLIRVKNDSGGTVTLSISPDGEVGSVTKSSAATEKDVDAAFDAAIATGKVKFLNGFETVLPDIYAKYGFKPVARLKFDPKQQPPGWSYQTYKKFNDGKPDVIFMRFTGELGSKYNPEGFPTVQSYEAGIEAALTSEPTTEEVTAPTAEGETVGRRFPSIKAMEDFVNNAFLGMAKMLGIDIVPNYLVSGGGAQYNATRGVIEYNPRMLLNERSKNEIRAIFREEIIHAAMHNVLMRRNPNKSRNAAWLDFMGDLGRSLTQAEKDAISGVYLNLDSDVAVGSEYSRAVIQQALYGEITESYASKAFKKLLNVIKSVQSYMARVFGGDVDIDPEVAQVIRDSAELVLALDPLARLTNQKVVQKATDIANMAEGNQELTSDVVANAGKPPSKKAGIGFFKKYLFTPSVIMDSIHPELSRLFHKFFNGIDMETLAYMKRVAPFIKKFNAIKDKKDKRRLKQLIYYSPDIDPRAEDVQPRIQERTALLRKYDMLQDYEIQVRSVLNAIRQRAIQQGMDVAFLNDYFPRLVLDLDSIREYYGETIVKDFSSYIERINEVRRKELDPKKRKPPIQRGSIEEALEFEKYIRSGEYTKSGAKPRNTKARTIEFIDDEILDSYADPGEAIEHYIHSMILSTRTMQLLGRRYEVEGENILFEKSGELGALIQRLVMNNEIDEETAFRTIPQFARIILNPVMKENAFLSNLRSFSYLTLLVEPTSTLSNLFDLPFVMYQKGFFPTLSAMLGKKAIRLEDIGIDPQQISLEFKSEKKLIAEAVRIGLKSTGFTRLDQLLKETNLNANYNYYRKLSRGYLRDRSSNVSKKLKVELDFLLGEDADAAIAAFAKGDRNNALVREVVLRKILETQPLNRMEIPLGQSESANKRMLYTMKSFQVKQLNFVVNRMLSKIFSTGTSKAEKAAASRDLAKLMFFMLLVGMPVDAMKDLLAGRIGYLSDYVFNGIFRIAGVSRYTAYQIKREGVVEGLYKYFTPVGMQQIADIGMELQLVLSGKKAITDSKLVTLAPFSDVINRLFGFTQERERKEYKRRIKKGEGPILIPPGSLR